MTVDVALIPAPVHSEPGEGVVDLARARIDAPGPFPGPRAAPELEALAAELLEPTGIAVGPEGTPVRLRADDAAGPPSSSNPERYTLTVTADGVDVAAPGRAGVLHGLRSLRQLAGAAQAAGTPGRVAAVVVHDEPRYPWRGLSLDVARHFFGPADLRAVVDLLAGYKMNRLGLHLTDDQGWRLEIPSRPDLVALSSQTAVNGDRGGHLGVDDFAELQEYAAAREIVVVPEIDLPGHVNAATHAYGELNPDGRPTDVYEGIEVGFSRLHLDLPATEPFLRDVLGDVASMTHGPWVHIGGDEVHTMEQDEYLGFVELCQKIVESSGRTAAAWQEAAGGTHPGTVLHYWDPRPEPAPFLRAAAAGARFVMAPARHAYLDMKYTPEHPLGLEWAGHVELRDSYEWDPAGVIEGLPGDAVEGVSAAVWTETLVTRDELFSMLLPRLAAVAETAWTPQEAKGWEGFRARVVTEAAAWRRDGAAFHPTPQVDW